MSVKMLYTRSYGKYTSYFFARKKSNWACIAEFQIFALNLVAVGCNMIFSTLQNYKATNIRGVVIRGGRVVRCRTCDREVVVRIPPAAAVYQCQLKWAIPPGSVNEYQRKLGSKQAYHVMHWSRIRGLAALRVDG